MADETPLPPVQTTPLPPPPTLTDPANFDARGDAFVSALQDFQEQSNAQAQNVAHNAAVAYAAATNAQQQAEDAMGYRNQAGASAGSASESAEVATAKAAEATQAATQAVPAAEVALTAAQRAEEAAASIEDGPVTQVNGKTGAVTLSEVDVGAVAESTFLARMHAAALSF